MKRVFCVLLALMVIATMALTLAGCEEKQSGPATSVSAYKSKGDFVDINADRLTWDAINSFPIVSDDTTIEEGRQMVVDFFRFAKTALWIPNQTHEYAEGLSIEGGVVFGGLPYVSMASGSIYRLMDYMDEETSVVNMEVAGLKNRHFGNQCSFGSYVGMGRVINSAAYAWTVNMTPKANFIPLGGYECNHDVEAYDITYTTTHILENNGQERMNECYAQLKHGDVIVYYTTAGHVVMISGDAHVERLPDGTIDAGKSYVTVIDQTGTIAQGQNEAGDSYKYEQNVDAKMNFLTLFSKHYVPFTFHEWVGDDPIEKSVTTFSHSGDSITYEQLETAYAESNYGIMDLYASFYDKNGNEIYKMARRAEETSMKKLEFKKMVMEMDYWGHVDDLDPKKDYTVKVYAQISTGERPVLWEGKLAQ